MMNALQTGLTIESTIGNKRVLHNGLLGVYEDLKPVHANEVAELGKELANLKGFIQENTKHKVTTQTFGLMVSANLNQSEIGRAFIGYDEGVDFNLRLCYATDTFLAMELTQLIRNYKTSDKTLTPFKVRTTKEVNKGNEDGTKVEEATKQEDPDKDCGWGISGEQAVMGMLEERATKLETGYVSRNILTEKEGSTVRTSISTLLNSSKDELTKVTEFNKESTLYTLVRNILEIVSVTVPHSVIKEEENTLVWKTMYGENVLTVYDKELVSIDKTTAGSLISMAESPAYKSIDKLLALLVSNVGYAKLIKNTEKALKESKEVKKVVGTPEMLSTPLEEVVQVQPTLSTDYYDMYLARAGKWGKKGKKFEGIKAVIAEVVQEYGITCATLRGLNDKEVVIDWVMDNKSYTMAITERATRVNELEVTYDTAIAYDVDYPEVLGVFIKEKLDGLKQSKVAVNA